MIRKAGLCGALLVGGVTGSMTLTERGAVSWKNARTANGGGFNLREFAYGLRHGSTVWDLLRENKDEELQAYIKAHPEVINHPSGHWLDSYRWPFHFLAQTPHRFDAMGNHSWPGITPAY